VVLSSLLWFLSQDCVVCLFGRSGRWCFTVQFWPLRWRPLRFAYRFGMTGGAQLFRIVSSTFFGLLSRPTGCFFGTWGEGIRFASFFPLFLLVTRTFTPPLFTFFFLVFSKKYVTGVCPLFFFFYSVTPFHPFPTCVHPRHTRIYIRESFVLCCKVPWSPPSLRPFPQKTPTAFGSFAGPQFFFFNRQAIFRDFFFFFFWKMIFPAPRRGASRAFFFPPFFAFFVLSIRFGFSSFL